MKIALLGAGGKMGCRITDNLKKTTFEVRHVEISERGKLALAARGVSTVAMEEALDGASVVILALPDHRIGSVTSSIEHLLPGGTLLMALDIAAPLAGMLPKREDLHYFVTHPCHPSIFSFDADPEAQRDFFGGQHARQNIVCCLFQGSESAYELGEQVARAIYAPVDKVHRCTAEQMAILEPVLSETVLGTCLTIIREALDESVRRGVPPDAARDFLFGHLKVELAIVFELFEGAAFSDGAMKAIEEAKKVLFKPDWKRVFDRDAILQSIHRIAIDS